MNKAGGDIKCPCVRCENSVYLGKKTVYQHLIMYGFHETYVNWVEHGETPNFLYEEEEKDDDLEVQGDDFVGMVEEAFGFLGQDYDMADAEEFQHIELDRETKSFLKSLQEAKRKLYPGGEFTQLSFILRLLHVKSTYRWSNKSFSVLLEILKKAFPESHAFPGSYREAWNMIKGLGLEYKKIHACPNDCMLYWKETENETRCPKCLISRYKHVQVEGDGDNECRKVPAQVVRYFPLKPRLQRLFMCSDTSQFMRWHANGRLDDGHLRHPADSLAWNIEIINMEHEENHITWIPYNVTR